MTEEVVTAIEDRAGGVYRDMMIVMVAIEKPPRLV